MARSASTERDPARPHGISMAISRPQAIDDALGTSRSTAEDGGRAVILFRDAKALAPAENSRPAAIAAEAIEASAVLRPDQAIKRRRGRVLTIGERPGEAVGLPHLFDTQAAGGQGLS